MLDMDLIESIRATESDIKAARDDLKVAREAKADLVAELPESRELANLIEEVSSTRKKIAAAAKGDHDIERLDEQIAELTLKLTDLQEILSHHLVEYRETSKTTFIEQGDSSKVRPIILSAKLGKPEYHQEAIPFDEAAR